MADENLQMFNRNTKEIESLKKSNKEKFELNQQLKNESRTIESDSLMVDQNIHRSAPLIESLILVQKHWRIEKETQKFQLQKYFR